MKDRNRIFYGWFIVAANFLILFSLHGVIINTFGVFLKPVSKTMGWSQATFPGALGIGALAMGLGAPFVGKLLDVIGASKTMLGGALLCGTGMALLGGATTLWHFYMLFAIVGLGLAASTSLPVSLVTANWFDHKRGIAMGLSFTGTTIGGMIMNPVNTFLIQTFGWRNSYVILGIAMMLVTVPLTLLIIRTRPSDMNLSPNGSDSARKESTSLTGQTLREALCLPSFWFIAANMFLINVMANSIGTHGVAYLTDIGHTEMAASVAIGLSMGFMTLGKLGSGLSADRWGARPTFVASCIMTAAGIVVLMFASNWFMLWIFAFAFGFPQGGPLTLTPLVTANCFGLANFGPIFGVLTLFSLVGAAIGPVIVGKMYNAGSSYQSAFVLLILITLASAYCIHRARPEEVADQELKGEPQMDAE